MNETIYLEVIGMHCQDCPKKVERSVSKLDGVSQVKVNYETENGYVTYNKELTDISDIMHRINKMGFEAKVSKEAPIKN
ncbi:heavy-metal-associated domain-containing protein [Paucisalibacillus sp. EB02]|uniref:heavy-metal-associated domain-containing protein n=1 Tax=Paucisalibacillus sp. EB02 TaxID=1347087 RepID=UPI0005AB7497|nr:heavy metal-associated domain-containing protein [Paucisalibacillus sp. EB02]